MPDTFVRAGNRSLPLGGRSEGFAFDSATVDASGNSLRLHVAYSLPAAGLRVTRHYAITPGSPTFEVWTSYVSTAHASSVSDLNAFEITVPAGPVHYLTGLQGDAADVPQDRPSR